MIFIIISFITIKNIYLFEINKIYTLINKYYENKILNKK